MQNPGYIKLGTVYWFLELTFTWEQGKWDIIVWLVFHVFSSNTNSRPTPAQRPIIFTYWLPRSQPGTVEPPAAGGVIKLRISWDVFSSAALSRISLLVDDLMLSDLIQVTRGEESGTTEAAGPRTLCEEVHAAQNSDNGQERCGSVVILVNCSSTTPCKARWWQGWDDTEWNMWQHFPELVPGSRGWDHMSGN